MTGRAAVVTGLGSALPSRIVTNAELTTQLDVTDEWVRSRTGIRTRRWVGPGTVTADLAVAAAADALACAGTTTADMLVLATTTPDHPCPATAPDIAARLGLDRAAAFDVAAVCAGFVHALAVGSSAVVARLAQRVVVVGAEIYSTILDPADRDTVVLFGDGAGAMVLEAGDRCDPGALLEFDLGSDGRQRELIQIAAGGARQRAAPAVPAPRDHRLVMQGRTVFAHAVRRMGESATVVLDAVGWPAATVDAMVAHQANIRILHALAARLGIDRSRAVVHLDRVGNTSAASIPLACADAAGRGLLTAGDRVLITAFGGGLTWGSTALVWPHLAVTHTDNRPGGAETGPAYHTRIGR